MNKKKILLFSLVYYPDFVGGVGGDKLYLGKYHDEETDLEYLEARYYNSTNGQFISQDPVFWAIGNPQSVKSLANVEMNKFLEDPQRFNSYSYSGNNPIGRKDPEGRDYIDISFSLGQTLFSSNIGLKYDFDKQKLDLSAGISKGFSVGGSLAAIYSVGNLPSANFYKTEKIEFSFGYVVTGQASFEAVQSISDIGNLNNDFSSGFGLGLGAKLSSTIGIYENITLFSKDGGGIFQNLIGQIKKNNISEDDEDNIITHKKTKKIKKIIKIKEVTDD